MDKSPQDPGPFLSGISIRVPVPGIQSMNKVDNVILVGSGGNPNKAGVMAVFVVVKAFDESFRFELVYV